MVKIFFGQSNSFFFSCWSVKSIIFRQIGSHSKFAHVRSMFGRFDSAIYFTCPSLKIQRLNVILKIFSFTLLAKES